MFQSAETLHSLETVCQILREINFGEFKRTLKTVSLSNDALGCKKHLEMGNKLTKCEN